MLPTPFDVNIGCEFRLVSIDTDPDAPGGASRISSDVNVVQPGGHADENSGSTSNSTTPAGIDPSLSRMVRAWICAGADTVRFSETAGVRITGNTMSSVEDSCALTAPAGLATVSRLMD